MSKPGVIFVGPVPPPFMGPSLATEIILKSALGENFNLIHLDTSHHADLSTLGKVGISNIFSALKHYLVLLMMLVTRRPAIVYIPISQTTIGYLRDSVFILLSKLFMRKVVCHLRGGNFRNWYEGTSGLLRKYVRFVHKKVDIQIVLGEKLRCLFENLVPDDRIHVVPNGRDFDWPEASRQDVTDGKRIRILYLSNFVKTKGVLDVLRSVPRVAGECKNAEFVFAGAWYDEDVRIEMQEMVRNNPDYPIRIIGKIAGVEKFALINSANVFVFPTYYPPEGHPWAVVEALAAGLPVISTDQGAITESVLDGVNGYIVDKQNPDQLAERIITLCRDTELAERMGRASKAHYAKEFTEKRMVERMTIAFNAAIHT